MKKIPLAFACLFFPITVSNLTSRLQAQVLLIQDEKLTLTSTQFTTQQVTASDYCNFLNNVARQSDVDFFYDAKMSSDACVGCIARVGAPGSYKYFVIEGKENTPIAFVNKVDEEAYCSWMRGNMFDGTVLTAKCNSSLKSNGESFEVMIPSMPTLSLSSAVTSLVPFKSYLEDAAIVLAAACMIKGSDFIPMAEATSIRSGEGNLTLNDFRVAADTYPTASRLMIQEEGGIRRIIAQEPHPTFTGRNRSENILITKALKDALREANLRESVGNSLGRTTMTLTIPDLSGAKLLAVFRKIDTVPSVVAVEITGNQDDTHNASHVMGAGLVTPSAPLFAKERKEQHDVKGGANESGVPIDLTTSKDRMNKSLETYKMQAISDTSHVMGMLGTLSVTPSAPPFVEDIDLTTPKAQMNSRLAHYQMQAISDKNNSALLRLWGATIRVTQNAVDYLKQASESPKKSFFSSSISTHELMLYGSEAARVTEKSINYWIKAIEATRQSDSTFSEHNEAAAKRLDPALIHWAAAIQNSNSSRLSQAYAEAAKTAEKIAFHQTAAAEATRIGNNELTQRHLEIVKSAEEEAGYRQKAIETSKNKLLSSLYNEVAQQAERVVFFKAQALDAMQAGKNDVAQWYSKTAEAAQKAIIYRVKAAASAEAGKNKLIAYWNAATDAANTVVFYYLQAAEAMQAGRNDMVQQHSKTAEAAQEVVVYRNKAAEWAQARNNEMIPYWWNEAADAANLVVSCYVQAAEATNVGRNDLAQQHSQTATVAQTVAAYRAKAAESAQTGHNKMIPYWNAVADAANVVVSYHVKTAMEMQVSKNDLTPCYTEVIEAAETVTQWRGVAACKALILKDMKNLDELLISWNAIAEAAERFAAYKLQKTTTDAAGVIHRWPEIEAEATEVIRLKILAAEAVEAEKKQLAQGWSSAAATTEKTIKLLIQTIETENINLLVYYNDAIHITKKLASYKVKATEIAELLSIKPNLKEPWDQMIVQTEEACKKRDKAIEAGKANKHDKAVKYNEAARSIENNLETSEKNCLSIYDEQIMLIKKVTPSKLIPLDGMVESLKKADEAKFSILQLLDKKELTAIKKEEYRCYQKAFIYYFHSTETTFANNLCDASRWSHAAGIMYNAADYLKNAFTELTQAVASTPINQEEARWRQEAASQYQKITDYFLHVVEATDTGNAADVTKWNKVFSTVNNAITYLNNAVLERTQLAEARAIQTPLKQKEVRLRQEIVRHYQSMSHYSLCAAQAISANNEVDITKWNMAVQTVGHAIAYLKNVISESTQAATAIPENQKEVRLRQEAVIQYQKLADYYVHLTEARIVNNTAYIKQYEAASSDISNAENCLARVTSLLTQRATATTSQLPVNEVKQKQEAAHFYQAIADFYLHSAEAKIANNTAYINKYNAGYKPIQAAVCYLDKATVTITTAMEQTVAHYYQTLAICCFRSAEAAIAGNVTDASRWSGAAGGYDVNVIYKWLGGTDSGRKYGAASNTQAGYYYRQAINCYINNSGEAAVIGNVGDVIKWNKVAEWYYYAAQWSDAADMSACLGGYVREVDDYSAKYELENLAKRIADCYQKAISHAHTVIAATMNGTAIDSSKYYYASKAAVEAAKQFEDAKDCLCCVTKLKNKKAKEDEENAADCYQEAAGYSLHQMERIIADDETGAAAAKQAADNKNKEAIRLSMDCFKRSKLIHGY